MVPATRWLVVGLLALAVALPPTLVRLLPAEGSSLSAAALADRVRGAPRIAWAGEVRTQGVLDLPVGGSTFGGVARLLGESSDLRVWWRDQEHWRVDRMRPSGETDLVRNGGLSVRWEYEDSTARFAAYSPIRLPDDNDVLPATLAARLLAGARAAELTRLPSRRVAGHSAAGLRLAPADPSSSIDRVDVWADNGSGLPLRVEVYGGRGPRPVLVSEVRAFTLRDPTDREIGFELASGAGFTQAPTLDDVASANAFAPFALPGEVAGLARRGLETGLGAVGIYGRGPTALLALPLRDGATASLRRQLAKSRSARTTSSRVALEVGPLSVLLVEGLRANFLLTGTVTPETLEVAADDLERDVVRLR